MIYVREMTAYKKNEREQKVKKNSISSYHHLPLLWREKSESKRKGKPWHNAASQEYSDGRDVQVD